jgi:hypothetical protein
MNMLLLSTENKKETTKLFFPSGYLKLVAKKKKI